MCGAALFMLAWQAERCAAREKESGGGGGEVEKQVMW